MNCDKADQLIDLLLSGEASSSQIETLNEHAASCQRCAKTLAEAEQTAELLTRSMGALAAAVSDPNTFVRSWVATSEAMTGTTTRPPSSRRATPVVFPRVGVMAAMLMGGFLVLILIWLLYPKVDDTARRKAAINSINTLNLAIQAYYGDFNTYPPSGDESIVRYLDGDPSNGGPGGDPYTYFPPSLITKDQRFLDPWGNPFHYRVGANTHNPKAFDLWSEGPKKERKHDILANWMDEVMKGGR